MIIPIVFMAMTMYGETSWKPNFNFEFVEKRMDDLFEETLQAYIKSDNSYQLIKLCDTIDNSLNLLINEYKNSLFSVQQKEILFKKSNDVKDIIKTAINKMKNNESPKKYINVKRDRSITFEDQLKQIMSNLNLPFKVLS